MSTLAALFVCIVLWAAIMTTAAFVFGAAVVRDGHQRRNSHSTKRTG